MARITHRPECVMLRLAEPLRAELAVAAAEDAMPLAAYVRKLLLSLMADRLDTRDKHERAARRAAA
jgi:hypothetical protein